MLKKLFEIFFPSRIHEHYETVRYAFPLVIVTALIASLAALVAGQESYVTIRSEVDTVTKDQVFYIDVTATVHVPINAVDLLITYPEEQIAIESIDTGTSVITLWTEDPYAENGNIYLRGGTFRKGFLGEHTIARIKARAVESGEARIFIKETQLVAGDGKGTDVPVLTSLEHREARIVVGGESGVLSGEASISLVTDTNGDGEVNLQDVSAFMAAWFTKGSVYDFNGDGKMTFRDFSIILAESFLR